GDWRHDQTNWQAERLNDPLIAFTTQKHAGSMGREFSLLKLSTDQVRVLALKKAEDSDEVIVRLVELDGKQQHDVRISLRAPITAAREVNGEEQPVGPATLTDGVLITSFGSYQPRTFALKLAASDIKIAGAHSESVKLKYDVAVASNDGVKSSSGFDGK